MRFIHEMEGLVSSQLNLIKTGFSMTKLEARLAILSIYPLIINVCMLFVVLLSSWLTAMGMLFYGLMHVVDSLILALSGIFLFNLLILAILFKYLLFNLKNMSFEKTRAYLARGKDELKKTGQEGHNKVEQDIVVSAKSA